VAIGLPSRPIDPIKRNAAFFIGRACQQSSVRPIVQSARSPEDFIAALLRLETRLREETHSSEVLWPVLAILVDPFVRKFVGQVHHGAKHAQDSKKSKERERRLSPSSERFWRILTARATKGRGVISEAEFDTKVAVIRDHVRARLAAGKYKRFADQRREVESKHFSLEQPARLAVFGDHVLMPLLRVIRQRDPHEKIRDSEVAVLVFEILHSYFPAPVTRRMTPNAVRTQISALSKISAK
jgi:hypothetical protein